jgi:hypothetical protein
MKNVFTLPTDKPSTLIKDIWKNTFSLVENFDTNHTDFKAQNIYITSNEVLPYDSSIFDNGAFYHRDAVGDVYIITKHTFKPNPHFCKRIILTTDGDLIKDGVQAIDDEFLECFVKNPSIDEVEVSYGVLKPFQSTDKGYMIHLPDNDVLEEPKTKCYCGHTTYCDCGPEQELDMLEAPMPIYKETLEEAAEEYGISVGCDNGTAGVDFMAGAKYQQEQDKKMYSELVDLLERLATIYKEDCDLDIKYDKKRLEFIEQLKKK